MFYLNSDDYLLMPISFAMYMLCILSISIVYSSLSYKTTTAGTRRVLLKLNDMKRRFSEEYES